MALSTKPYRGARDFYPEDKRLQKYIFSVWRKVAESFGYEEYDAPILEPLEIYLAKSGQEIVNEQTYVFTDRGDRQVVIRPEMTPTVSRMVAAKRQELIYPLRWYSIPNLWRYERPQRGRLREHWQLNVDIFGVKDTSAELEIITVVDAIFKGFGATTDMFEIRLNHRELINYLLNDYLKLSEEAALAVSKLIDRIHKMDRTKFLSLLDEILTDKDRANKASEKLLSILDAKTLKDLPEEAKSHESYKDLEAVLNQLSKSKMTNVRFDSSLMRGFDYYTGIIFEVFDLDTENNRSMMGGGRYDGLVGLFGVEPVPTVGFGWGDVTLINFLENHGLSPELKPEADIAVALIGDVFNAAQDVLSQLRDSGLNITVDLSGKRLGDQFKAAEKKHLDLVLIIGEDELKTKNFKLKNLKTTDEQIVTVEEVIKLAGKISKDDSY
jgi:histidyl-tRNA synthetase